MFVSKLSGVVLAGVVAVSGAASAATIGTLDISGVTVNGTDVERTLEVTSGTVTGISFDFTVSHASPSWGSETRIQVIAPDATEYEFAGNTDFGFSSSPGDYSSISSQAFGPVTLAGIWRFIFSDSYDDLCIVDHEYLDGSFITLTGPSVGNGTPPAAVPVPAGLLLLGTALGGLGFAGRRKRG